MALELETEVNGTGYMANYIKVDTLGLSVTKDKKILSVNCSLYKDKVSKDAGKEPISTFTVNSEDLVICNGLIASIYATLKSQPQFEGAKDV